MKKIDVVISMNISKENTYYVKETNEDLEEEVCRDILNSPLELTFNIDDSKKWVIDSIEIIEEPL